MGHVTMSDELDNIVTLDFTGEKDKRIFTTNKNPPYMSCKHPNFTIDVATDSVECGLCHEKLSPMWVLVQLSDKHNYLRHRYTEIVRHSEKAQSMNRCKCDKCGKMTRIIK